MVKTQVLHYRRKQRREWCRSKLTQTRYSVIEASVVTHDAVDTQNENGPTSPVSTIDSNITNDNDGGPGRRSHLYQAQPHRSDGKYHCAYEGQPECVHEPTKLKCNYEYVIPQWKASCLSYQTDLHPSKYIDSHLKPYRCKQRGCEELRFSSTACRLRHEREAHGSHGHGVNPYLCHYEGCDRSKPDKGFPRAWNRNDHMKRCHGHIPTENEDQAASPTASAKMGTTTSTGDEANKQESRKRSGKQIESNAGIKRQKTQIKRGRQMSTSENHESAIEGLERHQRLHDEWRRRRLQLQEFVHNLQGPNDSAALHRIQSEVNAMVAINQELAS